MAASFRESEWAQQRKPRSGDVGGWTEASSARSGLRCSSVHSPWQQAEPDSRLAPIAPCAHECSRRGHEPQRSRTSACRACHQGQAQARTHDGARAITHQSTDAALAIRSKITVFRRSSAPRAGANRPALEVWEPSPEENNQEDATKETAPKEETPKGNTPRRRRRAEEEQPRRRKRSSRAEEKAAAKLNASAPVRKPSPTSMTGSQCRHCVRRRRGRPPPGVQQWDAAATTHHHRRRVSASP